MIRTKHLKRSSQQQQQQLGVWKRQFVYVKQRIKRNKWTCLCFAIVLLFFLANVTKTTSVFALRGTIAAPVVVSVENESVSLEKVNVVSTRIATGTNTFDDVFDDAYTVVLNTYKRDSCLKRVVNHWRQCEFALDVRISWSDVDRNPPDWLTHTNNDAPAGLVIDRYDRNRLTNRFFPVDGEEEFKTNALFSIDDDLLLDCELIDEAFQLWRRNKGERMVGVAPRLLKPTGYKWDEPYEPNGEKNTLFVTKGAFVKREAYDAFFAPKPAVLQELRRLVDKHTTAEDMLMSIVYANTYGTAPIHVSVSHAQISKLCCRADEVVTIDTRGESRKKTGHNCLLARPWYERWRIWELGLGFRSSFSRGPILERAVRFYGENVLAYTETLSTTLPSTTRVLEQWENDHDGYPFPYEWI